MIFPIQKPSASFPKVVAFNIHPTDSTSKYAKCYRFYATWATIQSHKKAFFTDEIVFIHLYHNVHDFFLGRYFLPNPSIQKIIFRPGLTNLFAIWASSYSVSVIWPVGSKLCRFFLLISQQRESCMRWIWKEKEEFEKTYERQDDEIIRDKPYKYKYLSIKYIWCMGQVETGWGFVYEK